MWIDYTDQDGRKSVGREVKPDSVSIQKDCSYLYGTDPAAGYRSFRIDRVSKVYTSKPSPALKVGQRYRVNEWKDEYILATPSYGEYVLINLLTGNRWHASTTRIEDVFAGQRSDFTLIL